MQYSACPKDKWIGILFSYSDNEYLSIRVSVIRESTLPACVDFRASKVVLGGPVRWVP